MATQPSNLSQNSSAANNGIVPMSQARMALDNLLRRELKVSDPNDPKLIAEALLTRYQNDPKAIAIQREAQGVPFLTAPATPIATPMIATSSDTELQQAIDDVNRDLQELTTNTILKDISIELQGWTQAIRTAITEGVNAARFAIDPRQRDKAFGIRRTLGDYARMARLVGTLTPSVGVNYRKLAQSLDEIAAVLLVKMGEALANVGFSGGRFLLQVPYNELQVRRDAAIAALRSLLGATQQIYSQDDWPRGLDAYRQLYILLETTGQGDLRALLVENELARTMDELIQRAGHGSSDGLRALGATAQLDLERFRRLVAIGRQQMNPESPPLVSFLLSLQLFVDAFDSAGGFRLLRIARPPILFYGLYGFSGLRKSEERLLRLVIERGLLADKLDCFMQCCNQNAVICQIVLDKILYDVDRAIDLYAIGENDLGEPELRASAYSFLITRFLSSPLVQDPGQLPLQDFRGFPRSSLITIQELLRPVVGPGGDDPPEFWDIPTAVFQESVNNTDIHIQELCIQKQMENRWKDLLKTMAPNCVGLETVFDAVDHLLDESIEILDPNADPNTVCQFRISLPPTQETSWNTFTHAVFSSGRNRSRNL